MLGGVAAALAVLALIFATSGYRGPVARLEPRIKISPEFVNAQLAFDERNTGTRPAIGLHTACVVRGADSDPWPAVHLHAPAAGSSTAGTELAPDQSIRIALEGCINASSLPRYPGSAYFFVRYFTAPAEEHVEETLIRLDTRNPGVARYGSVDPAPASAEYRDLFLTHLRRYAPPPT